MSSKMRTAGSLIADVRISDYQKKLQVNFLNVEMLSAMEN